MRIETIRRIDTYWAIAILNFLDAHRQVLGLRPIEPKDKVGDEDWNFIWVSLPSDKPYVFDGGPWGAPGYREAIRSMKSFRVIVYVQEPQ